MIRSEWRITKNARELAEACRRKVDRLDAQVKEAHERATVAGAEYDALVLREVSGYDGFRFRDKIELTVTPEMNALSDRRFKAVGDAASYRANLADFRRWLAMFESAVPNASFELDIDDVTLFGLGES